MLTTIAAARHHAPAINRKRTFVEEQYAPRQEGYDQ